jgi:hypothetical protein
MLSVRAEEKDAASGSRRCVLLAGVHKGGAGAISRILVHLGVDQACQTGGFADRLRALNNAILQSAGFEECSIEPLYAGWYSSLRHVEFHKRAVELVDSAFASSTLFVLKDAAIGRLVPFWQSVLKASNVDVVVLDFYQDPASYIKGVAQEFGVGGDAARAIWLARVIEAERASRGLARANLTGEALLDDWEAALSRLSHDLGISWPAWSVRVRKAIVEELARAGADAPNPVPAKAPQADQLGRWIAEAQDILWRWALDGEDDQGRTRMDALRKDFEGAHESLGFALASLAEMGREVRHHKQVADDLLARVAHLQGTPDARSPQAPAGQSAGLDVAHAAPAAHPGQHSILQLDADGEASRVEAKWLEVFRARLEAAEILTEQNNVFQAAIERLTDEVANLKSRLSEAQSRVERLRLVEIAQKASLASARAEAADVRKARDDLKESLEEARKRLSRLREEAADREVAIERLQNALLARSAAAGPVAAAAAPAQKLDLSPKSLMAYLQPKRRKKMQRHRAVRQLVVASGMFDEQFYAERYPDVVAAGADLLDHFIICGGAEGRHPGYSFNSKWYLKEYADVRSSGANPLVHYLEHGRDEGRRRRSLGEAVGALIEHVDASAAPTSKSRAAAGQDEAALPQVQAEASELEGTWRPRAGGWKAMLSPELDRSAAIVPLEELSRQADGHAVALDETVLARMASDTPQTAIDRIALFAALRSGDTAGVTVAGERASDVAPHALLARSGCGIGLLADGWCDSGSALTLRLSNGFPGVARVFQPDGEGTLHCVAEAVPEGGEADCIEVRIIDPVGPLLLVLAGRDGALVDSAVVPFPSLLRGGLHYGELAVLETAPGSMATLAEYSQMLALEWLGWDEGPDSFAIGRIAIDMRGASGTEPIFRPELVVSIARHFGVAVGAHEGSFAPERSQLVAMLDMAGQAGAARDAAAVALVLPSDALPSIYALVARRMPHDRSLSRFAVVDAATARPQADISLPFDEGLALFQHADMPAHAPYVLSSGDGKAGDGGPVFPLAVRHYNRLAWQADPLIPVSPDRAMPAEADKGIDKSITVIIEVGQEAEGIAHCLAALENQIGAEALDVILAGWPDDLPLPRCELPVRSIDRRETTRAGRLNAAAQLSEAERLMFLASGVLLSDPRTAATLSRLADHPGTASVACALVTEPNDDGEARVHSAGYFPTRVSLHGEPVFDFDQIDVARAMPAATFPVVANHAKCVLLDAAIFRSLGGFDAQRFPMAMHDLDFGFRALAAGHANLCTTLVRAAVEDAAPSADFPDPLAHRSVRPAHWQSLLERVTVIRELRR